MWNPVNSSADWPSEETTYLVTLKDQEYVEIAYINSIRMGELHWYTDVRNLNDDDVLAWMPIPSRYAPAEEGQPDYQCKHCKTPLRNEGSFSTFVCGHMNERSDIGDLIEPIQ